MWLWCCRCIRAQSRAGQHEQGASPITPVTLMSQYLHVTEDNGLPHSQPPLAVFSSKSTAAAALASADHMMLDRVYSVERNTQPTGLERGGATTSSEVNDRLSDHSYENDTSLNRLRQPSRSVDNLSAYMGMSGDSTPRNSHENDAPGAGVYSYARTFDISPPADGLVSPPSVSSSTKKRLQKTSSTPTVLDADSAASVTARGRSSTANRDDYVPPSPPYAAISDVSGNLVGAGAGVSDKPVLSPTASEISSNSDIQSTAIMSPVAGISMSTKSRVFTRQK